MLSMRRSLTATLLLSSLLLLIIVAQPNGYASANAASFSALANPATQSDVGIHVETSGAAFMPGDAITFTLTISNSGPDIASGIIVTDIVPAQILTSSFASTLNLTPTDTLTYVWSIEPLGPGEGGVITISGQINPALPDNFSFINAGAITDPDDTSPGNNASQVFVGRHQVFLPMVMRNWPPIPGTPVLNPISNHVVSWAASTATDTYTLQRDTVQDFSHPSVVYDGSGLAYWDNIPGYGYYYYRVRANNSWGNHSPWSNTVSTYIALPTSDVWIYNETGATITVEIVSIAKQDFAPGTYKWVTIPYGTYTINTWTQLYYYHITYLIGTATFNLHVGS